MHSIELQPVILSGGSGTRLWPLSREQYPKQLLALVGNETMLQATAGRDAPLPAQAGRTLEELSQTLRALRDLADTLESRPQSLIFGKEPVRNE